MYALLVLLPTSSIDKLQFALLNLYEAAKKVQEMTTGSVSVSVLADVAAQSVPATPDIAGENLLNFDKTIARRWFSNEGLKRVDMIIWTDEVAIEEKCKCCGQLVSHKEESASPF